MLYKTFIKEKYEKLEYEEIREQQWNFEKSPFL